MESCLTELAKTCVDKLINGAIAELRYVFCFTCIANEFEENKNRLVPERKTLEQRVKVAAGRDKDILANVQFLKGEVDKLIKEDITKKQTCFFGFCPDCLWRYKRGKELANKTEEIKRLTIKAGKLENIELPRCLPGVERFSSENYILFESRVSKYKELLDALKDDNNYIIGLQGMGGTGKTTLAIEVGKELKQSEQFSHVIDTTVSSTPDIKKIQDDIAGPLGLTWENCNDSDRPRKLWSRLTNGEKILLIMDDVWDQDPPLDFDRIGIPQRDKRKGCRVFITTRFKQILNKMDSDKIIELELLSEEESWTMFERYVGKSDISSKQLSSKGREIAKECKGLPVAIAVIASSLKGRKHLKRELDATLKSLKFVSREDVPDHLVEIYKCLKSSYDYMKDEKAKGLFLLSSVFPEDEEIPFEILTRLGIGTGLFGENYVAYDAARAQVVTAITKLIDSCLLVEVDERHVKMHDLVRDAARLIANKEIQSVNLSNKDQKSLVQREINMKYLFCEGKDTDLFSYKYDGSKLETLIVKVDRDEDRKCMEVPSSFFQNIVKLRVLRFSANDAQPLSLPHSVQSLVNIRSVYVDEVDLGDISVLGNLQSLETLELVSCTINELPQGITKLEKFRLLNLKYCEIRRNNPFEVIERCSALEELYFIDSFNDFCLEITMPKLRRYHIQKGIDRVNDSVSKSVSFDADVDACFFSKETFKYCMQTTEVLQLNEIKEGWRNLMPEIVPIHLGMNDLVKLCLSYISQLQCLIDTIGSHQVPKVLSSLVVLILNSMENLEEMFNGSLSFDSLKNLENLSIENCKKFRSLFNCKLDLCSLKFVTLRECPVLVSLFPLSTSRNLVGLERLEIVDCEGLKNIITDERGEEGSRKEINESDNDNKSHVPMFPKLKVLHVQGCHQLEWILPILSSQDLPVLEIIDISCCDGLKYIFGQYQQHVELGSLKVIKLFFLQNFEGMFPKHSNSITPLLSESSSTSKDDLMKAQIQVDPIFSWSCICCHGRDKHGSMSTTRIPQDYEDQLQDNSTTSASNSHHLQIWERVQYLVVQPHIMCNIIQIELSYILKIKSVFILSTAPRMLVETLRIRNCDELKHLIVDIGDHESVGNNWGNVFPRLKRLYVESCMQLEYIFGHYTDDHQNHTEIHLHLPALQHLDLDNLQSLVAMCPEQYRTTFPSLKVLELKRCSQAAFKSIGELSNHSVSKSLDSITKELSGSVEHFSALEILMVYNSKAENIFCLNEKDGTQMNLSLQIIDLYGVHDMKCLFVGPKNSFALKYLASITIMRCEILEIVFSTSILRCLSQLVSVRIKECKELKYIVEDDMQNQFLSNSLSSTTCFPMLETLVVVKCHKLKHVFPVSICKELPELKALMIREADELEEIFKINEGNQKVETPKLDIVVFVKLPSLFHTQGIQFQAAKNRFVLNCQNLSLTSASTPDVYSDIYHLFPDYESQFNIICLFKQLQEQSEAGDPGNENQSAETTEDVSVGIEVEAALGHKLISSQIQTKQTPEEADHATVENDLHLEIPSEVTNSPGHLFLIQPLVNEQSTSQQCLTNQNHPHGEIDSTVKPSQGTNCLNEIEDQRIEEGYTPVQTVAETVSTISDTRNQQPIQLVSPKQKCVEEGTALSNVKLITPSTHLELVSSLQEQDVDVRETTDTAKINDDQGSLNDDVVVKERSVIEEHFFKDDEFRVSKFNPFPGNSIPLPLAFRTPSMPSKGNPSQIMEDLSSPSLVTRELEQLVSNKHLDYENLSLLMDFLVKQPSLLLKGTSLSNRYKGYAYNCLAELLKSLQIHSVLDVSGPRHSEFVELLQDVRKCAFDKDWLDGVEKRALFPDLQFSQGALQKLLDSKKQVTKDVEVMRVKIDALSQHVEDLKHQLTTSEAILESIIQEEAQILETKVALSAPLGY